MIFGLLHFLEHVLGVKVPAVFLYSSTRMALAAITSLLICVAMGPLFIRWLQALKMGQPIQSDDAPVLGQLHAKKADTPTMGGILILGSMMISGLLFMNMRQVFTLILLLTTVYLGVVGAWDDGLKLKRRHNQGLSGRTKLGLQVGFALLLATYLASPRLMEALRFGGWFQLPFALAEEREPLTLGQYVTQVYVPFFKHPLLSLSGFALPFFGILTVGVVAGTSNAVNLADGLDGLAVGLLALVAATLGSVAFVSNHTDLASYLNILYIDGSSEIAVYLFACVGACLGFLWYNGHPAQVFMGDTGSLALGGVLGVSAVLLARELLLAIVGGVFVAEALSVMLQVASYRLRNQKRIFLCSPLHHHFEYKGWHEAKVVIRFWIIGLLLAIIGVASLKFQ